MNADTPTRALAAIDAATARADAATAGPWTALRWRARHDGWFVPEIIPDGCPVNDEWTGADADFIAHARTDVPLLGRVAFAVAAMVADAPYWWWVVADGVGAPRCWRCWQGCVVMDEPEPPHRTLYFCRHLPGCPVPAIEAALADLVVGEVGR